MADYLFHISNIFIGGKLPMSSYFLRDEPTILVSQHAFVASFWLIRAILYIKFSFGKI